MARRINTKTAPTSLVARIESNAHKPGGPQWRDKAKALYEYMNRNMADSVALRARKYPKNGSRHDPRFVPFVWRVVREKTPQKIERTFAGLDGAVLSADDIAAINQVYADAGIDRAMRSARKQLVALQQSTVWLWPAENNWDLKACTIPVHRQAVRIGDPTSDDEDSVREWYFEVPTSNDPLTGTVRTAVACITPTSQAWTQGLDVAAGSPVWGDDVLNSIGRMPVAMMRGEEPEPGYWWCELPDDLLFGQRALNMSFTTSGVVGEMQGFAQGYIKGMTPAQVKEMEVGSEVFIGLPQPEMEVGFAAPSADLEGAVKVTEQYMQAVVSAEGLSPQTFLKSTGITALAKRIENQGRDAERRWDMDTIQRAEQRIYDLARAWLRALRGADVLPEAVVTVEARDVVDVVDPLHDAQALQLAIFAGQTDQAAARAKRDGVSFAEGMRRVIASYETEAELAALRIQMGLSATPAAGGAAPVGAAALNAPQAQPEAEGEVVEMTAPTQGPA